MDLKCYKLKPYFNSNKEPFGVTINGKIKEFIKAHEEVKRMLLEDKVYRVLESEIKVVEVTNNKALFVAIVEVGGKDKDMGNVEIKVHAPGKKGATIELRKMSGFDYAYVELLKSMMIVFIDRFIAGEDVQQVRQNFSSN